jgi:hypothetical protein
MEMHLNALLSTKIRTKLILKMKNKKKKSLRIKMTAIPNQKQIKNLKEVAHLW